MIRTEEIREVPADVVADFCDFAKVDWSVPGWLRAALMSKIERMWLLRNANGRSLAVVGVYQTTLVGGRPELFLLFTNEFVEGFRGYASDLRRGLRVLSGLYPEFIVRAACGKNSRFAKIFGLTFIYCAEGHDFFEVK